MWAAEQRSPPLTWAQMFWTSSWAACGSRTTCSASLCPDTSTTWTRTTLTGLCATIKVRRACRSLRLLWDQCSNAVITVLLLRDTPNPSSVWRSTVPASTRPATTDTLISFSHDEADIIKYVTHYAINKQNAWCSTGKLSVRGQNMSYYYTALARMIITLVSSAAKHGFKSFSVTAVNWAAHRT